MDVEANKNIVGNGFMSAPVILLFSFIPLIPFIIMAFPSLIHQNLLFLHKCMIFGCNGPLFDAIVFKIFFDVFLLSQ